MKINNFRYVFEYPFIGRVSREPKFTLKNKSWWDNRRWIFPSTRARATKSPRAALKSKTYVVGGNGGGGGGGNGGSSNGRSLQSSQGPRTLKLVLHIRPHSTAHWHNIFFSLVRGLNFISLIYERTYELTRHCDRRVKKSNFRGGG